MADRFQLISEKIAQFSMERDWERFHTVKNLILAAQTEFGELTELVLWLTDDEIITKLMDEAYKDQIGMEIADVIIYLIRLSQVANIDITSAIDNKITTNELKYPVEKSKGNSKKYTEF